MIEENRNSIIIRNVDVESDRFKKFERNFSVYDPLRHKYVNPIYTIIDSDVHIPATITSYYIQTFFPDQVIVRNYAGTPIAEKINFSLKHEPRDDIQREALAFLCKIKSDKMLRSRMLNLATGSGKTYVTIATISKLAQKAMIVVDTTDLAAQWKEQFLFHTDLQDEDILIMSGRESVEAAKNGNHKIYIAIQNTLGMLLSDDLNSINQLMHKLKIGIRVFDEAHVNFHNTCMINSLSNVNYTIYLTATPNRSDYKEDLLYGKVFSHVPSYDGHKKDNEKYHKIVLAYFDSHPTEKQQLSIKTKYGFSVNIWAGFVELDTSYTYYIDSLLGILNLFKLVETKKKFAIMLPTINLINKTYDDLTEKYPDIEIGKFIGATKKTERSDELNKQIILTNNKIFGKGIDIPDLDCIINYVQFSSQVNAEQIIGRLRNNPGHSHVLIDVTDNGYSSCRAQQRSRKTFYKKIAKEIKEIKEIF